MAKKSIQFIYKENRNDYRIMISHKYKCIFLHKGRTGGTSIEHSFNKLMENKEKHLTQSLAREEYKDNWNDYFIFTTVRNPYDWMVSCYFHNKQINHEWFQNSFKIDILKMTFGEYIEWGKTKSSKQFIDDVNEIDYIIRFEDLQKGFDYVCEQIGKPKKLLERIESSTHKPYMEYYIKQSMIDDINEMYRENFEQDGYERIIGTEKIK